MIEIETDKGLIKGEPLFTTDAVVIHGGEVCSVSWEVPDFVDPKIVRWVLIEDK